MKLLVLSFDFPPVFGGKSTMLKNIFERTRFEKTLITVCEKNCKEFDEKAPFKIVRIPKILFNIPMPVFRIYFFKVFFLFLVSLYYLIREKPNHIIAGQLLSEGAAAYYLKRFFGASYSVFTYDTIDAEAPFFGPDKKIAKKILKNATKIFYISSFMKKKLISGGAKEKDLILIYPTCDPKIFVPGIDVSGLRKKLGINGKVILTVSRIVERKGIDKIIKVLPGLKKKIPNIKYVVVGDGNKKAEFKELAEKFKVKEDIIFTGFVSEKELVSYYNLCDVFAMPSSYLKDKFISEGFGIVFLEANACEKPVIGVAEAGMLDAVENGKTGLLLETGKLKELESALFRVLTDKALAKRLGKNGRKRVVNELNWDLAVKNFEININLNQVIIEKNGKLSEGVLNGKKMNICMVSRDFFPEVGGIASHVLELSLEMARQEHNVHIVKMSYENKKNYIKKIGQITVHYIFFPSKIKKLRFLLSSLKTAKYLNQLIKKENIQIVHWHDYLASWIETKLIGNKVKRIFTNHSSNYLEDYNKKTFPIVKSLLGHADAIIAPSDELVKKSWRVKNKANVFYIPNGVDKNKFMPKKSTIALKKKLGISREQKIVLCPRRLEPKNGVIYFAKSIPLIRRKVKNVVFLIVGGGYPNEKKKIENEINKTKSSSYVKLVGSVKNEEMPGYYNLADVVVLPSLMEATSIAGLEAMACEKPVIGTRIGGIPEIIENNKTGFLVKPYSPKEIALKTIQLLQNNKQRKLMGKLARKKIEKEFSWKKISEKTLQVYDSVIE